MKPFASIFVPAILGFFFLPVFARAEIRVTEVAWMGTAASANDEWIEIHNEGSSSVDLSGWTLSSSDGTPSISLSGTIGAGEYKLLERTDDTTFPGITALVIFTGAIGNEGESLALKEGGATIQSLSYSGGWPAGDVATKHTMQWNGASWITASESAGGPTTGSGGDEEQEDEGGEETSEEITTGASIEEEEKKVYETMLLKIERPKMAIAGAPTLFHMEALNYDRRILHRGEFHWNMGDGSTTIIMGGSKSARNGFSYTYEHPGTYHVTVKYWKTNFEDMPADLSDDFVLEVFEPTIAITRVHPDGGIEIKNASSREIDLSRWRLRDPFGSMWVVPDDTKILAGKTFTFSKKATRLSPLSGVDMFTPGEVLVASFAPKSIVSATKASAAIMDVPYKEKTVTLPRKTDGQVLGASQTPLDAKESQKDKNPHTIVWILAFVILVLVAVVAALLLKREEKRQAEEDEFQLLDE